MIRFNLNFYVYKSKLNIMYVVSLIHSNLSPNYFPFKSIFFLSPRKIAFFVVTTVDDCFPWYLLISSLPTSVTTCSDCCYRQQFNPDPYFFTIWHVSGWQRSMRRPPQMIIQNGPPFIIVRLSPGGGLGGGVFQK